MAISLVGTAAGASSDGSNIVIALPTCLENDLVCVMGGHANAADAGVVTSGYTEEKDVTATYNQGSFSYKRMSSSPDTSVTCLGPAVSGYGSTYVVMVFRGVDTTTAIDTATTTAETFGADPNSPSITTVTNGAAVISFGLSTQNGTVVASPTGYGSTVSSSISAATQSHMASAAWKTKSPAGAENPSTWDYSELVFDGSLAFTIALRPASAGTFGDGVLAATGTATASFVGPNEIDGQWTVTATGTAAWVGQALATTGALSASGTGTVAFVGIAAGDGVLSSGLTATVSWVGDKDYMTAVLEIIESRGAVSVEVS